MQFFSIQESILYNSKAMAIVGAIVIVVLSLAVSRLAGTNEGFAFYLVAGILVFVFAFLNTDFALTLLIFSMLLSPEFALGTGGGASHAGQREIVVRIDDLLLGIITVSWLIKTAINKDIGLFIRTPLNRPIFAYIVASVFSTVLGMFSGNVKPIVGILYNVKYFQYFMLFFMVSSHIKSLKVFKRYLRLLLFTAVVVSIYAIIQIPSGVRVSAPFEGEAGEANTLGGYLIIIMFIVIGMMTGSRKTSRLAGLGMFLGMMLIPFIFTLSRSSWISFFPAIIAVMVLSPQRKSVITIVVIIALISPAFIPRAVIERVQYTFSPENTLRTDVVELGETSLDPSTSQRIQSWKYTIEQWSERPVFGWGVTGAGFKDAQYFRVLAESGTLGFFLFFWLLVSVFREAKKSLKKINNSRFPAYYGIVVGYIAAFWGLLFHAIGANTFIIVRVMEPFWFLTAMIIALPGFLKEEELAEDLQEYSSYIGKIPVSLPGSGGRQP